MNNPAPIPGLIDPAHAIDVDTVDVDARASLLEPGRNCCSVTQAERVAVLIDADAYFHAFAQAAERAERSIIILAWDFDSRTTLSCADPDNGLGQLGAFLNRLARRRKRLQIRILDWDFPLVFGTSREFSPLYGFTWKPHRRIRFRYDGTHPLGGSHHQKIVVIDDRVAFAGGLDLTCRRWDTPEHKAQDPRRVDAGVPYPPFHDVMIALEGPPAQALGEIARQRWLRATGERLQAVSTTSDPWPSALAPDFSDVRVAISRTMPEGPGTEGVREVEQLFLDMIAAARRYIYIENQYFTSSKIGAALAARLAEPDGPEIVVVSRRLSHGWLEEMTMQLLRTRLVQELHAADHNGRFHIYSPHIEGLAENTCVDVHSKVMIVDDQWLRIGSANASNRSMGLDTECDVLIEAAGSTPVASTIRRVRDQLLGEHLGVSHAQVEQCIAQTGAIHKGIEALSTPVRTLQPLVETPQWSDAVMDAVAVADPERPVSIDRLVDQFAPTTDAPARQRPWRIALGVGVVLLGLALAWRYTPLSELVTPASVVAQAEAFASRWWAPIAVVLAYTPASVLMFPRPLITLAAVIAFGPWIGLLCALTGIQVAAGAGYLGGRIVRRDTVRRLAGARLNRLSAALRERGLVAMTAVRLVPIAPFAVVSVVAGAIHITPWHFALGTLLGMLPGVLAATVFGKQVQAGLHDAGGIDYTLLAVTAVLLVVGAVLVQRWLRRIQPSTGQQQPRSMSSTHNC